MDIDQRLAEIGRLQALADAVAADDFAGRYELQKQIDELKKGLPAFDKDAGRTREDIEVELAERRRQLQRLLHDTGVPLAPMSDGAGGSGDAATVAMRQRALDGAGIDDIKRRIGELESALSKLDRD